MGRLNRDTVVAIVLLMACGVMFNATFDIRTPDYGQLMPSTWPRVILSALTLLCVIYLFQSIRQGPTENDERLEEGTRPDPGFIGWLRYWQNPIWCFVLFFLYLATLPYLGSLIGGVLFVFALMGVLGGWSAKQLVQHAVLAIATVGGMWALFTYGLGVILPPGIIFSPF